MKKYVIVLRDKKLGAFGDPVFKVEDVEHIVELVSRSLKDIESGQRAKAADQALYYLGTYDDISGKFDLLDQPEKLLDYEDFIPRLELADESGKKI